MIAGIRADDTAAARAERMKLYAAFLKDMDSDGKGASAQFSEIDLSDPEDVKALIPDGNKEVLVHFGTENFLARYRKYGDHIVEWRTQYPRLSSVDMRYERQVVLQMPQKDSTVTNGAAGDATAPAATAGRTIAVEKTATSKAPSAAAKAPVAIKPVHASAAKSTPVARSVKPAANAAKDAAMRKRVEAIKAWMVKREKARAATQPHPSSSASGAVN